jgi:hypothetical protein
MAPTLGILELGRIGVRVERRVEVPLHLGFAGVRGQFADGSLAVRWRGIRCLA